MTFLARCIQPRSASSWSIAKPGEITGFDAEETALGTGKFAGTVPDSAAAGLIGHPPNLFD